MSEPKPNDFRRGRLLPAAALLAAAVLVACSPRRPETSPAAYRGAPIVVVSIDTVRADRLPAWGHAAGATPAIDALARESIRFAHAFSPCPLTLPAHVSLLTGLTPPEHGVRDNLGYRHDAVRHPGLPSWLAPAGYSRGAAVSAYVLRGATGLAAEFDFFDDELPAVPASVSAAAGNVQRPGTVAAERLLAWIGRQGARPFFAWLHLYEPHAPYAAPSPFRERLADPYDAEIAAADAIVGQFFSELRARGIYDRAIVVLLSDHGEGLGEHGEAEHGILLYRWALHVPLLLKLPGGERAGEVVDTPTGLVDLAPTLARLVGVTAPDAVGDRSLLDTDRLARRAGRGLYAETFYPRIHLGWSELTSVVTDRLQLIEGGGTELYDWRSDPRQLDERSAGEGARVAELAGSLARQRGSFNLPAAGGADEIAALRALGYLGGSATAPGPGDLPSPRTRISLVAQVSEAFRLAASADTGAAIAAFDAVLAASPGLFDAQYALAETLARAERWEEALAAYERARALSPTLSGEVALPIAQLHLKLGHLAEAERHARVALAAQPGPAHLVLARAALERGDAATADREATAAGEARDAQLGAAVLRAELRLRAGDPAAALAALDSASTRQAAGQLPPAPDLDFLRGEALGRLNRLPEAAAAFRRELAAFPGNSPAAARLALVLAMSGRPRAEVQEVLEQMVRARPSPESAELAARTCDTLGDARAAAQWRAQAEELRRHDRGRASRPG